MILKDFDGILIDFGRIFKIFEWFQWISTVFQGLADNTLPLVDNKVSCLYLKMVSSNVSKTLFSLLTDARRLLTFCIANSKSSAATVCCKFMSMLQELKEATTQQYKQTEQSAASEKPQKLIFNPLGIRQYVGRGEWWTAAGSLIIREWRHNRMRIFNKYKMNAGSTTEPLKIVKAFILRNSTGFLTKFWI